MGHSLIAMESSRRVLIEFNDATTISMGDVVLRVETRPIILNVKFSMVADLSLYNVILEWVWLHKMKVIPSTYLQTISYLTEQG